jgi:hypothetical protein
MRLGGGVWNIENFFTEKFLLVHIKGVDDPDGAIGEVRWNEIILSSISTIHCLMTERGSDQGDYIL